MSRLGRLEKFTLNFSSYYVLSELILTILVSLRLLSSLWCLSILVSCYFQVSSKYHDWASLINVNFRFEILVPGTPKEVEFFVALEDYRDDHNNICLQKNETVVVLDRLSRPGMYKVVRLLADGSKGNEIWVPSTVLQRKKSTAEVIMPAGNTWILNKYI